MNFKMLFILPIAFMMIFCGNNDPQPTPDLKYPATFKFKKMEFETPKLYVVQSNGDLKEFPNSPTIPLVFEDLKEYINDIVVNDPDFYGLDYVIKSPTIIRLNSNGDTISLPYERNNTKISVKDPATKDIVFRAELIDNKTFKPIFQSYWWVKPKSATLPFGAGEIAVTDYSIQEPNLLGLAQSIKTKKKLTLNDTIIVSNFYGIYE